MGLGGALGRVPRVPNRVPGRDAAFNPMTLGALVPPIAEAVPHASGGIHAAMAPWATTECLITFLGPADADDLARERLAGVSQRLRQGEGRVRPDGRVPAGAAHPPRRDRGASAGRPGLLTTS